MADKNRRGAAGILPRLRKLSLALPEAHEVKAWGEPTFRVRNKLFAMYAAPNTHHGDGRAAVWCKAAPGNQALMVQLAPGKFFVPPYVGPSGWVGIWLDRGVSWPEVAGLLRDAYRMTAPKRLLGVLDEERNRAPRTSPTSVRLPAAAPSCTFRT